MPTLSRVLLIDDDGVDRAAVRRALKSSNLVYTLTEAVDGKSGLEAARREAFDCVLLDYRLPDVEAFELLAALIAPEGGRQAVIMLTGEVDQELAVRLVRAGALDYLTKVDASPSNLARAIRYAKARRGFVDELEKAREDAEEKSRALANLNRQKTMILSIIAHDLRNSFHVLLRLSQTLASAAATKDPAFVEVRAQALSEAAGQAHTLMEGLFSWASVQMDSRGAEAGSVNIEAIARECIAGFRQRAAEKDIALGADCGGLRVHGHAGLIAAMLRNLVGNAVKFTPPRGRVSIAARARGETVEIAVSDTGVGMTSEQSASLFKIDKRTSTPGTAGERGSGLGLLLCRDLAELQGSRLEVDSEPGRGTTFRFRLPRTTDLAMETAACDEA